MTAATRTDLVMLGRRSYRRWLCDSPELLDRLSDIEISRLHPVPADALSVSEDRGPGHFLRIVEVEDCMGSDRDPSVGQPWRLAADPMFEGVVAPPLAGSRLQVVQVVVDHPAGITDPTFRLSSAQVFGDAAGHLVGFGVNTGDDVVDAFGIFPVSYSLQGLS